ncbi:MAG: hypothetical protein IT353_17430 [Gemmatimonadaceae bacterium]|nr:hypothetical protein [Gemmatimonadaceae bacterium]
MPPSRVFAIARPLFTAIALLVCSAPIVAAQPARVIGRASLDLTLGLSEVRGGGFRYRNQGGVTFDALVGLRRPAVHGWMGAISGGIRFDANNADDCVVDFAAGPPFVCLPHAPTIGHVAGLIGYEARRGGSGARLLVGPALFSSKDHGGPGVRAQFSATVGFRHFGLTGGVSGNVISPFNGSSLRYLAGTFGVRIQ